MRYSPQGERLRVREMLSSHPQAGRLVNDALAQCIEACFGCAQACMSCADACLAEERSSELARCIRLDLDCADACASTGSVLTRRTAATSALMVQMLETCADFCRLCADECERHASHHEHCRLCAETCRQCASELSPGRERRRIQWALMSLGPDQPRGGKVKPAFDELALRIGIATAARLHGIWRAPRRRSRRV